MAQQAKTEKTKQLKLQELGLNFLISAIALVLAIITGGIIIALFGNNPFQAYGAVSYTHLDVYKRQPVITTRRKR